MPKHPESKKILAVGASATIELEFRLQVTGPSLGAIEDVRQQLEEHICNEVLPVPGTQWTSHHSGLNTDHVTIHQVTIIENKIGESP